MPHLEQDETNRVQSLELALIEQRRDHDTLEQLYDGAKLRNITYLAAGLAVLGFLYGNSTDKKITLAEKLFIPKEPYGVIMYFISLALFLFALCTLLFALKPQKWSTAYDDEQEDCMTDDYERYLKYMSKRYKRASRINGGSYARKQALLEMSFLPLIAGGILLLLLKTFGG